MSYVCYLYDKLTIRKNILFYYIQLAALKACTVPLPRLLWGALLPPPELNPSYRPDTCCRPTLAPALFCFSRMILTISSRSALAALWSVWPSLHTSSEGKRRVNCWYWAALSCGLNLFSMILNWNACLGP